MYHYLAKTKKSFIGKKIASFNRVSAHEVKFNFNDNTSLLLSVEGDCCSKSIFYEIVFPEECIGSPIINITEKSGYDWGIGQEIPTDPEIEDENIAFNKAALIDPDFFSKESRKYDVFKVWNVTLHTENGKVLIRHINSSNGYYDGETSYQLSE